MMKYFFPLLMAVVIIVGLGANLTPYIAGYFFPAEQTRFQQANADEATEALAGWFGIPSTGLSGVNAIRYQSAQQNRRWFQFTVERTPVERFIRRLRLQQAELDDTVLNTEFLTDKPPVNWWQPKSLQRKSYFSGNDGANRVKLIYNADSQNGFLLVESQP